MPDLAEPRVVVVIPAFQAAASIGSVVARVGAAIPSAAIVVVDDGSTDGTSALASVPVVRHPTNQGKGAALRTGIARALAEGAAVIVTLDADGQHPPEAIPDLLAPILGGRADLVLGARARTTAMPWPRQVTNWLSAALTTRIGGTPVPDAQTGFRAFKAELALGVRPEESSYDFEAAFLLGAIARRWRVVSVSIPTIYTGARSHFRGWMDSWRLARVFLRYSRRILLGAS
jgi:glycosyltransferase involved in cell wall biosynthesis